jgi:YVTN family beta-propeller protein
MIRSLACSLGVLVLTVTAATAAEPEYKVLKKFPVAGEGGWDYLNVDAAARRLYVTRGTRVQVIDLDQGTVVGEVDKTPGVHGVALVPDKGHGYSSNGRENTVTVFDLQTLREVARIPVGKNPDCILYDPATKRVFTMNGRSGDATAIDTETNKVVGTVKLDGQPEYAVADGEGHIYVNLENKSQIVALDAKELRVLNRWPIGPGKEPAGLAMDRKNRRLFSTCHNKKMVVLDADSGKVVATADIGQGTDACVFDPDNGLAFSSNGDGTLTVVRQDDADHYHVAANVHTQPGARTMALDGKTHNILLVTARAKNPPAPGQRRSFEPGSFVVLVVGR